MKKFTSLAMVLILMLCLAATAFAAGTGAQDDPYVLDNGVTETITVPAESTVYVQVDATESDMILNVNGNRNYWNFQVEAGMFPAYPGPGGAAEVTLPAGQVYIVPVTNLDTEAAAELDVTVSAPVAGTWDNPADLVLGENVANVAAGSWGYYFNWTATGNGTLTVTMLTDTNWSFVVNNTTTGIYGDTLMSDYDPVIDVAEVHVHEGDVIEIMVNTYDPADMWNTPAGQIAIQADFAANDNITFEHTDAKEATCIEGGNIEFWSCSDCGACWSDAERTELVYSTEVSAHPNLEYIWEGCYNIEHWFCPDCETYWTDYELTQITNRLSVIKAEPTHYLEHVEALEATCFEDGNIEHWYCWNCETVWTDEALTQVSNHLSVIIPAAHDVEHVAESCYNTEHWVCDECETWWADEDLTIITDSENVIKAEATHDLVHVEAKAPTATENGNVEHWYCNDCEIVWADEALTQITNHQNVIIAATGVPSNPSTGDSISLVVAIAVLSLFSGAALFSKKN